MAPPSIDRDDVRKLWLHCQGFSTPRGRDRLTKRSLTAHLERTGGLQVDTIHVVDRAHYLTLWSRFGPYDRRKLDRWIYRDRIAYEYWAHEASIVPQAHLPICRRRMRGFPPASWKSRSWWPVYDTSPASKRRVLRRLRDAGPLESADFERQADEAGAPRGGGGMPLPKEDNRSLKLLWHAGRVAVTARRHFRCLWDLAVRVYPEGEAAGRDRLEDQWLLGGLAGNGIAPERHLRSYLTSADLKAADRQRVLARNVKRETVVEVRVPGVRGTCYALPEHLDRLRDVPEPTGTTLICPFDSLLWQRERAEDLLDFAYRIEIYTPAPKRRFGYYVLPILHEGRLVGRLDPKLHRDRGELEIQSIWLERGFRRSGPFDRGLEEAVRSLADFLGAERIVQPKKVSAR